MSTIVTHHGSRRVTTSISYHSFTFLSPSTPDEAPPHPNSSERWLRPAQSVNLLFAKDLDPVNVLSENDRHCTFTPCGTNNGQGIDILTRNGRISGLMGLPRPYRALTARAVDFGGGFPLPVLDSISINASDHTVACCIAGGTGIAPFLTMQGVLSANMSLFWSVRSDDFGIVEFVLEENILCTEKWAAVTIFFTSGEESEGLLFEKPPNWWMEKLASLHEKYSLLKLEKRRITQADIGSEVKTALFCGSKSLEWQIRTWAMGKMDVYCTEL